MGNGADKNDLKVRSLVDHLTGIVLEYSLERGVSGHYESPIPIVGSDGRVQTVHFELFQNHETARVSANKIPLGVFPLSVDHPDNVFVQYVQRDGRLEVVSLSSSSLARVEASVIETTPIVEAIRENELPVDGGGHTAVPLLEEPSPVQPQVVKPTEPVRSPEVVIRSAEPAVESSASELAPTRVPKVRVEPVITRSISTNELERIVGDLSTSLGGRLRKNNYLTDDGKISLEGEKYVPNKILDYESAGKIIGKTKGALQQFVRNNGVSINGGLSAANTLKVKLFEDATDETYNPLSVEQLVALYGSSQEQIKAATEAGLFVPDVKDRKNLRVWRTKQRQVFYQVFDKVLTPQNGERLPVEQTQIKREPEPTQARVEPVRRELPREEPQEVESGILVEGINYGLIYNGENDKIGLRKMVDAYHPQYDQRKLEALLRQGIIKGNSVRVGSREYGFGSFIPLDEVPGALDKPAKNVHRRFFDLPEKLKLRTGRDFTMTPFTALALYPQQDPASGMIPLTDTRNELFIETDEKGVDRELLAYMKASKFSINYQGTMSIATHSFQGLSKSLRYRWAETMSSGESRKVFLQSAGYVDETAAMHHLTGNGVPVGKAYEALSEKLKPYAVLGMVPQRVLSAIQV